MQQEIKLTNESSNTVFVDDVDVSKGVYALTKKGDLIFHVVKNKYGLACSHYDLNIYKSPETDSGFPSLKSMMKYWDLLTYYTIQDNKRIVTEREVTIDDLKNTDHVGFVDSDGDKGYVVYTGRGYIGVYLFSGYEPCNKSLGSGAHLGLVDALKNNTAAVKIKQIIRFTERTGEGGLYEWLNKK